MRSFFCLFFICAFTLSNAQEFNSNVTLNVEQTEQPNLSIFKNLETALEDFINKNKWTDVDYLPQERIDCDLFFTITGYNNNFFEGTLQVQASRPVYNSG